MRTRAKRKVGYIQIFNALKDLLERETGYRVLDVVPKDEPSPFMLVELGERRNENTKTMWKEVVSVLIHAIAAPGDSREQIMEMMQGIEEAMTVDVDLGECVQILNQEQTMPYNLQQDETSEWHSVMGFEITICYGFRAKI